MIVNLLTGRHLEFLSLKGGCTGLSESTLVEMPHCWKSRATAQLTNPPVLAYADHHLPFKLHTDASSTGLGAVLYQHQDGQNRVVRYASRRLKPPEKITHPTNWNIWL